VSPSSDNAKIGSDGDGVIDEGVDFGVGEEANSVLEVEHLAAKLVGLGVDEDKLIGVVLGENDDVAGDGGKKGSGGEGEREGVGGVDREGQRVLLGIKIGREEEGE